MVDVADRVSCEVEMPPYTQFIESLPAVSHLDLSRVSDTLLRLHRHHRLFHRRTFIQFGRYREQIALA